jgi:hypothetical protein
MHIQTNKRNNIQSQRISDQKYSKGREIERNSKLFTIRQIPVNKETNKPINQ